MNYETAKVRMPSVLMNEKDIFCKNLCSTLFRLFHISAKTKISSNQELDIFYTINYDSFQ